MKRTLLIATAITGFAFAAQAAEVTVLGWGGAYTKSQSEAYHKPFTAETGITVNSVDADNPATPIKAQVEAGNVSIDVASVEFADGIRLCDEGLLEEIDHSILPAAPDGTPATEDFLPGSLTECIIGTDVYATVFTFNSTKFEGNAPTSIADFFDADAFPGKRGMRKTAKSNLEMALMADGVPAAEVYGLLGTDAGVDRAFAKLDLIKDMIVWWEAGAQPPQLLADGEVDMTTAYNGRIFNAVLSEDQPFEIVWDGQVYEFEGYVIPKGAPNLEEAKAFVAFAAGTEALAKAAEWISYGPPRVSSGPLVGKYFDGSVDMVDHIPTSAKNLTNALASSNDFWADKDTELNERFNAWLAN